MNKNKVKLYATESVIEEFYRTLANNDTRGVNKVHIPKSDVFYVRRAIYDGHRRVVYVGPCRKSYVRGRSFN